MSQNKEGRVKWIFFDLDDTLWNFSANSLISLKKLYEVSPILRKLFKTFDELNEEYHKHNQLLWDSLGKGLITTKEIKTERWRRTLGSRQFEVLTAVCEELDRNYLDILASNSLTIEGAREVLNRLNKRFLLGILSNGFPSTQYKKLASAGLDRYITRLIVSDEIGKPKPDKALFEYAINETGATAPFLLVGDHPETDIMGALNAGWYAIWINNSDKEFSYSEKDLRDKGIDPRKYLGKVKNLKECETLINNFFNSEQSHHRLR